MKVLVFGGTGFFGKELVELLLSNGHEVTLVSRGNKPVQNHKNLKSIVGDRTNLEILQKAFEGQQWDVAYDQIGYCSNDAKILCQALENKIKHLIFTSSKSVYDYGKDLKEEKVNTLEHELVLGDKDDFDYAEGKRQAEAYYAQKAPFKVGHFRPPVVIGVGDTSERWSWHLKRIKNKEEIYFPNLEAHFCLISSTDAAKALYHMGLNFIEGPLNYFSAKPKLKEILAAMEEGIGQKTILAKTADKNNHSPYGIEKDWYMSNEKANEQGLSEVEDFYNLAQTLSHLP